MKTQLKRFFQYFLILGLTVFLVWFSLKSIHQVEGSNKWDFLKETWGKANKMWLLAMAVLAFLSHALRALRWRMLIRQGGYKNSFIDVFFSLMVGYLVNLVIPRGGEVSRCYNLNRLDNTPIDVSFGTVVVERVVDLIFLLSFVGLAFLVEATRLFAFMESLPSLNWNIFDRNLLSLGAILILLVGFIYFVYRKSKKLRTFMIKTWQGIKKGLFTVVHLEKKGIFFFYSVAIWGIYLFMSYTVLMAFEATRNLGFSAVYTLFGIGSIAMALPLPGGTGSYHVLVPQGLSFLYEIPLTEAVGFTFIFHGWQTLLMIVGGSLSLILTTFLVKKRKK